MTDQTKQKIKYWLIGLFTGGAVAAPVTAFVCKNIYDRKAEEISAKAYSDGETNGMNAMAEYAVAHANDVLTEEDYAEPTDYDVSIDETDAEDEEARERTEAHQRYIDMIERYNGNADIQTRIINEDDFSNEQQYQKSFVNWYEDDDVFEEDLETIDDPYLTFGVMSGRELYKNAENRDDPDICYVRNERTTTDFEVSRIHGSYAKLVGGEASLGKTDT